MKRYILLAAILLLLLALLPQYQKDETMKITILDVGKADCIVIQSQDFVCMIDTAEAENYNTIATFLDKEGITKIDYLVITHFDKDHVGSAAQLIEHYAVTTVFQPNYAKQSEERTEFEQAMSRKGITPTTLTQDTALTLNEVAFTLLPTAQTYDKDEDNNYSIIVTMAYDDYHLLFMGDAKKERVQEFLAQDNTTYDFIKFPAHGDYHKAIDDLLGQTQPACVAITCSGKNPADKKTLSALRERDIKVYLTKDGSVNVLKALQKVSAKVH